MCSWHMVTFNILKFQKKTNKKTLEDKAFKKRERKEQTQLFYKIHI